MARDTPRPRKQISARRARVLQAAGFRYSTTRDAYVLRGVGNRIGPVYQVAARGRTTPAPAAPADSPAEPADSEKLGIS